MAVSVMIDYIHNNCILHRISSNSFLLDDKKHIPHLQSFISQLYSLFFTKEKPPYIPHVQRSAIVIMVSFFSSSAGGK